MRSQFAAARRQLVYRAKIYRARTATKQDGASREQSFGRLCRVVGL
jgi:hypothetical protein